MVFVLLLEHYERCGERLGFNEDEVVSTFAELKAEHYEKMQTSKEESLDQAVSDGAITEEQKQALLARWDEMKALREQHKEEAQAWFDEQGIDREALMEYGGFGHGGFKGRFMAK